MFGPKKPRKDDIKLKHELEDYSNLINPKEADKFYLLDNSTH